MADARLTINVDDTLRRHLEDAHRLLAEARGLLSEFVDNEPCLFDHNGDCQTHDSYGLRAEKGCLNLRARALLSRWDAEHPEGVGS